MDPKKCCIQNYVWFKFFWISIFELSKLSISVEILGNYDMKTNQLVLTSKQINLVLEWKYLPFVAIQNSNCKAIAHAIYILPWFVKLGTIFSNSVLGRDPSCLLQSKMRNVSQTLNLLKTTITGLHLIYRLNEYKPDAGTVGASLKVKTI